ncbi:hypothetical protein FBEOM_14014 [Fusarium beomiforme]|uniref:Uncharacterized protein n=1 Tax=Fusarium beomiforme TaxID=44412 RepID=A0A9P5A598_9HYPO|nr:hypothetical protein FBEOM_14014 [Fusarium beomiforme]
MTHSDNKQHLQPNRGPWHWPKFGKRDFEDSDEFLEGSQYHHGNKRRRTMAQGSQHRSYYMKPRSLSLTSIDVSTMPWGYVATPPPVEEIFTSGISDQEGNLSPRVTHPNSPILASPSATPEVMDPYHSNEDGSSSSDGLSN